MARQDSSVSISLVLDECLRAVSGFKGADDLQDFRLLDIQRISDCTRSKKISSAPSYELDGPVALNGDCASCGLEQWNEVIVKHLPESLSHASPIVSYNFYIARSTLSICTAIVRITASWALANICDALRHRATELDLDSPEEFSDAGEIRLSDSISLLVESALRLTKDGDKVRCTDGQIKSNAVRALGNLSRFIRLNNHSAESLPRTDWFFFISSGSKSAFHGNAHWLERMVQAFVSCVTTGNVKVCLAPTVYSILLLLLRDSTNFKIRIHAAVALAVPTSRLG
ncbi:hypothetical protein GW17_00025868 [Ensete ventricosum]|nr:hypothetical protein GW17_00025868 [Ensete ventricosum]RZR86887.1 hypothetical protein BHM03_00014174 [Ensete ventricosum]